MIIISHNRIVNLDNVIMIKVYDGIQKSRSGHTQIVFTAESCCYLTIKYDDFKEQLKNAGKANIRVLELDY